MHQAISPEILKASPSFFSQIVWENELNFGDGIDLMMLHHLHRTEFHESNHMNLLLLLLERF
ncbi:hypothetical protein H5410_001902 [Solanum commersonii]|uniref:Uncharacterized protein n=1 Tax=Solanum commersonii TaxID=4109 RepID=A0A9J6B0G6_SOLCO|nr:hypothetical protein H5410_001902 [Solanum commersonii]